MANLSVNAVALDPMKSIEPRTVGAMAQATGSQATNELGDTFSRMFNEVNNLQNEADRKIEEFATSPDKDIHGTMIALQKADLSLKLMMQIRAKLTAAYQDVMRMQL